MTSTAVKDKEELKDNYPLKIDFKPLEDGITNHPSYVILLGDSMLDNFHHQMDKTQHSVTALLRKQYLNRAMITNLAVDGSESRHVLYGIEPNAQLIAERKKLSLEPYPCDFNDDGNGSRVYPTSIIEEMLATKSIQFEVPNCYVGPTVIVSVGMVDLKNLIPIYDESQIFTQMMSWSSNLEKLLKELRGYKLNIVLVSLWEPMSDFYTLYETPRDAFVMVLNVWMSRLFTMAHEWGIPVIDMSRTLNTYDRSHYAGNSIFDNSSKSASFLVQLIDFVFKHHDFSHTPKEEGASLIYFGSSAFGGIRMQKNDMVARETYEYEIKNRTAFKRVEKEEKNNYNDDDGGDAGDDDEKKIDVVSNVVQSTSANTDTSACKALKPTHIILMGDSVLDDFYWLQDKTKDVRQQILDTYHNRVKCTNLAVDESTSDDVLYGTNPLFVYVDARKEFGLAPYPTDKNNAGKVEPLKILKRMIDSKEVVVDVDTNTHIKPTVVLSIGGNDGRVLLFDFTFNLQNIAEGMNKLQQNFDTIVQTLLYELNVNVIAVVVYEPYSDFAAGFNISRDQLLQIFELGANNIFALAEMYALPVIDLSRTFDPFDRTHYGSTSIEPSNLSGQFIVDLIHFVHEDFEFNASVKTSKIYSGLKSDAKGIHKEENTQSFRDGYKQALLARKPKNDTNASK
mmetsp:Transcript_59750/g.98643  ORF Transcript_59750/g.98643 Transcript_59750/m.98643 type:complete len:679 (+) Transcript_59750:31-2067(+)